MNTADISVLGTLPPDVRQEVTDWREALLTVGRPVQDSLRTIAARFGVSVQTARRKYDLYRKTHDIRALVNRSRVPLVQSALTPEFVDWFKALAESNQRATSPAYRRFKKLWMSGETIPGMVAETPLVGNTSQSQWFSDTVLPHLRFLLGLLVT